MFQQFLRGEGRLKLAGLESIFFLLHRAIALHNFEP